eukprot:TRINITY_DN14533_c0_g1_i1.p1 TRINITY_DN14533_c0_g1~~TRINITY_DN14533_c0_g1_i1.p1  ORF type:complete len:336 (+),score=56.67 TRINITY_DN14533_c0_g1_i1:240-1247(+)
MEMLYSIVCAATVTTLPQQTLLGMEFDARHGALPRRHPSSYFKMAAAADTRFSPKELVDRLEVLFTRWNVIIGNKVAQEPLQKRRRLLGQPSADEKVVSWGDLKELNESLRQLASDGGRCTYPPFTEIITDACAKLASKVAFTWFDLDDSEIALQVVALLQLASAASDDSEYRLSAMAALACCLMHGEGVAKDPARAISLLQCTADAGDSNSAVRLGWYFVNSADVPQDLARARVLFQQAAANGNSEGQLALGILLFAGKGGVPKDEELAASLFQQAADAGHRVAMRLVADLLFKKKHDLVRAVAWCKRSANEGAHDDVHTEASLQLANTMGVSL